MTTGPAHKVRMNSIEANHLPDHVYPDGTTRKVISLRMSCTVDGKQHLIVRFCERVTRCVEDTRDHLEVMGFKDFMDSIASVNYAPGEEPPS